MAKRKFIFKRQTAEEDVESVNVYLYVEEKNQICIQTPSCGWLLGELVVEDGQLFLQLAPDIKDKFIKTDESGHIHVDKS